MQELSSHTLSSEVLGLENLSTHELRALFAAVEVFPNTNGAGPQDIAAQMTVKLLETCAPEIVRKAMAEAAGVSDISSLVRWMAQLNAAGISLREVFPEEESDAELLAPPLSESETVFEIDSDDAVLEALRQMPAFQRVPDKYRSEWVNGMHSREDAGEYKTSPQKDIVRRMWEERLQRRFSESPAQTRSTRVFGLFGEEGLEAPIYKRLGIPDENLYSAEFSPEIYARMKASGAPFHLSAGNCAQAAYEFRNVRFDVMNVDLCGSLAEFFGLGDSAILHRMAGKCEFSINSRIRQDESLLVFAKGMIDELIKLFPEIEEYIRLLDESKKNLFPDETVRKNMVLREVYFLTQLVMSLAHIQLRAHRRAHRLTQAYGRNVLFLAKSAADGKLSDKWAIDDEEKLQQQIVRSAIMGAMEGSDFSRSLEAMPQQSFMGMGRRVLNLLVKSSREIGIEDGDNSPQASASGEDITIEEEMADMMQNLVLRTFWTRRYGIRSFSDMERTTYTHDTQHTFQTWFLRVRQTDEMKSMLEIFKELLDLVINSPERVVNGGCLVKEWLPPSEKREVPGADRTVEKFNAWMKGGKRRPLTEKERRKRETRRKMEIDARRTQRSR